ncbi:hypothetical protein EV384_1262 [Micromonospora kangleipakensis]|uniref:Uncharacterized protein n=1 Tax=Micromonospora kangleipakensis TaxID=1077942 RepID=A0A4Q8B5K9_9ACTN|nr:hypothetical protein [Micromonospora kangleipakensis]RZU72874.1 hypothetical protein EV384_1262 [Micromonospora kangleipakensis]
MPNTGGRSYEPLAQILGRVSEVVGFRTETGAGKMLVLRTDFNDDTARAVR